MGRLLHASSKFQKTAYHREGIRGAMHRGTPDSAVVSIMEPYSPWGMYRKGIPDSSTIRLSPCVFIGFGMPGLLLLARLSGLRVQVWLWPCSSPPRMIPLSWT